MKEKVFCTFILLLCLSSCKVQTEDYDSIVEMIPVNLKKSQSFPIEEIIDRIEIIPLETNDDCIVHMYKKLIYIKELEMFYFFDSKYNVYLFLFTPLGLDYHFYQIDANTMTLTPVIKLDFGSDEITRKQIESMTGFSYREESKKTQWSKKTDMIEISDALIKSSLHIPIVKLINDKYVYLHILSNHKRSNYIYNRITKKGYYQAANDSFKIYFGLQMEDNVLITMPQPYEIEEYIDKKLMSQEDIQKFDNIKEDDNPVIVKYYFK